ncbi:MAG TPA: IPT/TIG domain-containing protein [Pyrinomonadaceae bacterium]|nr:IPT/TIG domain-containing protein [Pyrinomonadaceae bacterium]
MRARSHLVVLVSALSLLCVAAPPPRVGSAQAPSVKKYRPDRRRALASRVSIGETPSRPNAYTPKGRRTDRQTVARPLNQNAGSRQRPPARAMRATKGAGKEKARASTQTLRANPSAAIAPGTPLSRVLHVSQLSLVSPDGTHEEFVDRDGDLRADDRATFDADGGSYDIAVGRTGARYEVFTAIDDRGTSTTSDDVATGILVLALDTNGDYVRDAASTYDLGRDFGLPSAVAVVAGTSKAGREFVVVSSSGFYNNEDPNDPDNEESPGVVLLVRDPSTGGFDPSRSRTLVEVGSDRLFNANGLALLPDGDLLVADFESNELRVVRDTNDDGVPDTLDAQPFYSFPFDTDAPLDVAANSRGVVFTHSTGNDTYMLALYDTDGDGYADVDEICVEGLSIDNNLVLHGLTVSREGTVFVIQDAMGESDLAEDGGNGGIPHVYAFPDPALNGVLRDGAAFVLADDEFTQAYSGLAFGVETVLPSVARLSATNSASLQGDPPTGGLATITGAGLTRGFSGATQAEATTRAVRVTIEGLEVPVLSFDDSKVHVHVPDALGTGVGSVIVTVNGNVTAADDATFVSANPGLFTVPQTGTGEAVALLVSGMLYTSAPFPARTAGAASEVALFGTGWRNSLPVTVQIGGKAAKVNYAGPSGGFGGLDQINAVIPDGVNGPAAVVVTTSNGATGRTGVFITVQ